MEACRRKWSFLALRAAVPLGLLASCAIFEPVQTPETDRRFTPVKVACPEQDPSANACTGDSYEYLADFHAGLGRAMLETDLRRRELARQAAIHTNINSTYDALLWPLGALFIARKIHHPAWSTIDVAAVGTAVYGLLGSGIPDRDKLYLASSERMACMLVSFEPELYLEKEIVGPPVAWRDAPSLDEAVEALKHDRQAFVERRDDLALHLEVAKPRAAAVSRTESDRLRLAALNKASTPSSPKDPTPIFVYETDRLVATADQQLLDAGKLQRELDSSGVRLRQQRSRIELALTRALNDRTPTLVSPTDRGREIAAAFETGIAAQQAFVARVNKESGTARADNWWPTPEFLRPLSADSRAQVTQFWSGEREWLLRSQNRLADWTQRHKARVDQARSDATAMGCSDTDLGAFAADLARKLTDAPSTPPAASGAAK